MACLAAASWGAGSDIIDVQVRLLTPISSAKSTHSIDPRLDEERAKVINDLAFSSAASQMTFVDRPAAPRVGVNATGDKIEMDSRMAVIQLR